MQSRYPALLSLLFSGCVPVEQDPPDSSGPSTSAASMDSGSSGEDPGILTESGGPVPVPQCGGGTIEPIDHFEFSERWKTFDPAGIPRWTTDLVADDDCTGQPVAGLVSALVIRNDRLPQPRTFVPDGARWIVWSNAQLDCRDPLGMPLCAGKWRMASAIAVPLWCDVRTTEPGGTTLELTGVYHPTFIEIGDDSCEPTRFMLADESSAIIDFVLAGDQPPATPQSFEFCAHGDLPGLDASANGSFTAEICL